MYSRNDDIYCCCWCCCSSLYRNLWSIDTCFYRTLFQFRNKNSPQQRQPLNPSEIDDQSNEYDLAIILSITPQMNSHKKVYISQWLLHGEQPILKWPYTQQIYAIKRKISTFNVVQRLNIVVTQLHSCSSFGSFIRITNAPAYVCMRCVCIFHAHERMGNRLYVINLHLYDRKYQ